MRKVMRYECKRLLWNRFFVGLVLVLLFYGWQVLSTTTILGVAHTAPFSPWSFGDYLSRMTPLLWVGVLFFLTFFTSPKARRVASLTDAAPMPPHRYALGPLRSGADRERAAGAYLPCAGGGVLLAVFWLVRLGRAAAARSPHPAACVDLRAGQRLAAGQVAAVGALCLDAGSVCVYGSAAARGAGDLEWAVFLPVSADAAGAGPGLFGTAAGGALPVRAAGSPGLCC